MNWCVPSSGQAGYSELCPEILVLIIKAFFTQVKGSELKL